MEEKMNLNDLIVHQFQLGLDLASAKEHQAAIQAQYDQVRNHLVPDAMEDAGVENIKIRGVGRVALYGQIQARIVKDKKDRAYEWLNENGHGNVIVDYVHSSTLKALIKELIAEGEIPDDLFEVHAFTQARITKS